MPEGKVCKRCGTTARDHFNGCRECARIRSWVRRAEKRDQAEDALLNQICDARAGEETVKMPTSQQEKRDRLAYSYAAPARLTTLERIAKEVAGEARVQASERLRAEMVAEAARLYECRPHVRALADALLERGVLGPYTLVTSSGVFTIE